MSDFGQIGSDSGLAKGPVQIPIWERAHRDLNTMRDTLMKAREEAGQRGRQAEQEINEIDSALSRIQPPSPQAMPAPSQLPSKW